MANGTLAASQIEMLSLSGTGIITITPPATNTNRAITLPDAAGAIVVSGTTPSLNGITFPATQSASANISKYRNRNLFNQYRKLHKNW